MDNHLEIVSVIQKFCEDQDIRVGVVSGIGAVNEATLRFLNPAIKKYEDGTFHEQMEIASLIGNISDKDGEVYLHIHATFGRSDYTCIGGHLLTAWINGACELVIEKYEGEPPQRVFSPELGLNIYDM